MRWRLATWLVVSLCATAAPALAQVQNGEIFGKVTDTSGAMLPGVTVTIESPALLQPQSMTTTATGAYRFASLPLGVYSVRFELAGFSRHVRRDVRIETGFAAEVSPLLQVSSVQKEVIVSGETPVIDTKSTTLSATFNQEMLDKLPSARDPWVILEQMPGMVMDRQNVGGSESGQQSSFIAHGSGINQQWNLNGATLFVTRLIAAPPDCSDASPPPVWIWISAIESKYIGDAPAIMSVTMRCSRRTGDCCP